MTDLQALERHLEAGYEPAACASEADFLALWNKCGLPDLSPVDRAVIGGLLADRPAWVFAAGYQATLRNAFPMLPTAGWAAFAATEDEQDPAAHPGTRLSPDGAGFRLNGCKSWVGHSRVVEHLVITVNDPSGDKHRAQGVLVPRNAAGVAITHREQPRFLASMSQGFVRFDQTPIGPDAVFGFEPIRQFGRTEAKFVMLAATAFMLARTPRESVAGDRLLGLAAAMITLIGETRTSRQVYGAIDREFQACVELFENSFDTASIPEYVDDGRFMRMYTARIQRRVGYAKKELQQV